MIYNQYLQSEHWQNKRVEKLSQAPICQVCQTDKNLNIHHKDYQLFKERTGELLTLCSTCHRLLHFYFGKQIRHKHLSKIRRLVNFGIDRKMAFYISSKGQGGLYTTVLAKLKTL